MFYFKFIYLGNFKEMCILMSKHDPAFKSKFDCKLNSCSPDIQNELVNICSELVKQKIISEIKKTGFFAIMVDDAR